MKTIFNLSNKIQTYAWGSYNGITDLIGIPNANTSPMAELWMGSHPSCPSNVITELTEPPLNLKQLIGSNPSKYLGNTSVKKFGSFLPFLFKVLSAAHPLSLQVHPTKQQAESGFALENSLGIPLSAPHRNYKDANHKPEIMLALTPFKAMCGFRPIAETVSNLRLINTPVLNRLSNVLIEKNNYSDFFNILLEASNEEKENIIQNTLTIATKNTHLDFFRLVLELIKEYPVDIGVLAPLYLNVLNLLPGEALFLDAGIMHAYIEGTGLELMASSDNVLRGGLTNKHIDNKELVSILNKKPYRPMIIKSNNNVVFNKYITPCFDFELSLINLFNNEKKIHNMNPAILLCTEGTITITCNSTETAVLKKGTSVFISAEAQLIDFRGEGKVYMASLPDNLQTAQ